MPVFKNRPNTPYEINENLVVWEHRSVVVIATVLHYQNKDPYLLLVQRSPLTIEGNKWCFPCGYLDFDESGHEAAMREAWEESGVDLTGDNFLQRKEPWRISTVPENRQNVSLAYFFLSTNEDFPIRTGEIDNTEILNANWFRLDQLDKLNLAFNHRSIAKELEEKILKITGKEHAASLD